jgi:hypothetical protein
MCVSFFCVLSVQFPRRIASALEPRAAMCAAVLPSSSATPALHDDASSITHEDSLLLLQPLRRFASLLQQVLSKQQAQAQQQQPQQPGSAGLVAEYSDFVTMLLQAMQPPVNAITNRQIQDHKNLDPRQYTVEGAMEGACVGLANLLTVNSD